MRAAGPWPEPPPWVPFLDLGCCVPAGLGALGRRDRRPPDLAGPAPRWADANAAGEGSRRRWGRPPRRPLRPLEGQAPKKRSLEPVVAPWRYRLTATR